MTAELDSRQSVTIETVSPEEYHSRVLVIDFLFFDRHDCDRCSGTEDALHAALDRIADLLDDLGIAVRLRKINVATEDAAVATGLKISPTIRIDGRDIQPAFGATSCESCTDIAGCCEEGDETVDCRTWKYRGREFDTPPVELLIETILRRGVGSHTNAGDAVEGSYRTTENLHRFFGDDTSSEAESDSSNNGTPCC